MRIDSSCFHAIYEISISGGSLYLENPQSFRKTLFAAKDVISYIFLCSSALQLPYLQEIELYRCLATEHRYENLDLSALFINLANLAL
jgi:hypothetical protein